MQENRLQNLSGFEHLVNHDGFIRASQKKSQEQVRVLLVVVHKIKQ